MRWQTQNFIQHCNIWSCIKTLTKRKTKQDHIFIDNDKYSDCYVSLSLRKLHVWTRKNCFRYLKLMSPLNAAICTTIKRAMNSSRIELLWLVWDQSRSKYYLRTKFQDGIDKPQKCRNICYHPTHQQQSDFLTLVFYDFIVQNILSSLLLLCYNFMIMNDY
jgi:hypothetical protein